MLELALKGGGHIQIAINNIKSVTSVPKGSIVTYDNGDGEQTAHVYECPSRVFSEIERKRGDNHE